LQTVPGILLGEIIGESVSKKIKNSPLPSGGKVKTLPEKGENYGEICELLNPLRKIRQVGYIDSPSGSLPVLGQYDVIVLGGGTAGATAGITAANVPFRVDWEVISDTPGCTWGYSHESPSGLEFVIYLKSVLTFYPLYFQSYLKNIERTTELLKFNY